MRTLDVCGFGAIAVLWVSTSWAQNPGAAAAPQASVVSAVNARESEPPMAMVEEPCPPPLNPPAAVHDLLVELFVEPRKLTGADFDRLNKDPQFMEFIDASRLRAAHDWAALCHYRAADGSAAPRVIFLGDSITENWALADPQFFQRGILNRGISGQTTPQMLVRYRQDVIALRPQVVHILGGTNDVAGNTGPSRPQDFKNNIMSMAELAHAHGIHVVLGSIPPAASFNWRPQLHPVVQIRELNQWLREYAAQNGCDFVDYYSALVGTSGGLKSDLSNDGVHPNRNGYRIMRALAEKDLARYLR